MDKAILVFDGRTPQPKKDVAHEKRYKHVEQNKLRLEELYKVGSFANDDEEKNNVAEVLKLRKKLSPIRSDMIYYVLEAVSKNEHLKDKIFCCGAPYEADHQLVSLFNQNIIDYAITTDSDLVCIGADVIIADSFNRKTGACWKITLPLLLEQMSEKTQKKGTKYTWNSNILHHVACLLGNDYIKRISGISVSKITDFVKEIHGLNEDGIYKHIYDVRTKKSSGKKAERVVWNEDETKRRDHVKLWKKAKAMFEDGPAFLLRPINESETPRDAFFNGSYQIDLGSLRDSSDVEWISAKTNDLLLGFHPQEEFRDLMDCNEPEVEYSNTEEKMAALRKECFKLRRWSKTGEVLKGLKVPVDDNGNELYFGSIIDFGRIPPLYHTADILKFYLESRQVKCPSRLADIRFMVDKIFNSHGDKLQPIPKILMRGVSGWIKEEVLQIREGKTEMEWMTKDSLLESLEISFPSLTENDFATHFGKRNGTRLRLLKHIQGGSFDLTTIRATYDMVHKLRNEQSLFIIEASCAPSQKLKDGNKDAFHNIRLCLEIDTVDKSFKKFLPHPSSICECPNGCISCAHIGGGIGYCVALKELRKVLRRRRKESLNTVESEGSDNNSSGESSSSDENIHITFEEILNYLPEPVHDLVTLPVPTAYAFPEPGSKKKSKENAFRRSKGMNVKNKKQSRNKRNKNSRNKGTTTQSDNLMNNEETNGASNNILQSQNHRVAAEEAIEVEAINTLADLREYWEECDFAIDGIVDNSVQDVVPVVENITRWTSYLSDGRDDKGRDLHKKEEINDHTREMANHESTDIYLATQCKVLLAAEKLLLRQKERNANMRSDEYLNVAPVDSGLLPLLQAAKKNIEEKAAKLDNKFANNDIKLNKLVPKNW